MKIFILIFVGTVIGNENTGGGACADTPSFDSERFTSDAMIHQLFELLRNLVRTGSTEHVIPILDPYEFEHANFNLDNEIVRVNMNVTNGIITGLGGFDLQQFNFSKTEVAINLNIHWPLVTLRSEYYVLEGDIKNAMPLLGHGKLDFEVHTFTFGGKVYLKQSIDGKSILIEKVEKPHFSIDKVISRADIDGNIDTMFNSMVEDLLAGYLTRLGRYLAARYSNSIIQHLNPTLEKFNSWSIITPIL